MTRYANLAATQLVATGTYGYNADSALTSQSEVKGTTTLASYTWSYDHMGRLTGDTVGTASDGYTYDAASELLTATHSGGGNETYSYDSNGNRTNTGYSTGTNNQLSSDGTSNYLYDASGNLTKKTTISSGAYVTYTWDYRNRLTDVKAYNSSNVLQSHENYVYDVFDRMIERNVDPTGGGTYTTVQNFIYSGTSVILAYNGSNSLTDRFLVTPLSPGGRGAGGEGAEAALADENGSGTVSWFLKNREGDTVDVAQYNSTTDTTTVVDHIIYSAFGSITSQTNSAYQPMFAYTGQMWDADAGLYWYHARWYDPANGRFISQDPSGFAAGDANLYRYVTNSPMNFTDPSGKSGTNAGQSGPVAGGIMQYGNFYPDVVGPGSTTGVSNGGAPPFLQWYSDGFNNMFGAGWSNAAGGVIQQAASVVGANNSLAGASDNALIAGAVGGGIIGGVAAGATGIAGAIAGGIASGASAIGSAAAGIPGAIASAWAGVGGIGITIIPPGYAIGAGGTLVLVGGVTLSGQTIVVVAGVASTVIGIQAVGAANIANNNWLMKRVAGVALMFSLPGCAGERPELELERSPLTPPGQDDLGVKMKIPGGPVEPYVGGDVSRGRDGLEPELTGGVSIPLPPKPKPPEE